MKFFVAVFTTIVMSACAAPSAFYQHAPLAYSAAVYQPVPTSSQWHAQSGLGDYVYGYQAGPSAKSEVKTLDGITQGSYSYVDAASKLQTVNYVADSLGFRVAATNLPTPPVYDGKAPEPVEDTPEVKAAKAEHLSLVAKAKNGEAVVVVPEVAPLKAPEPVEDTVEVKAAKAEHLKAVEIAKTRSAIADDVVIAPHSAIEVHAAPVPIHYSAQLRYAAAPVPVHYTAPLAYSANQVVSIKAEPIKPFSYAVHAGYPYYY